MTIIVPKKTLTFADHDNNVHITVGPKSGTQTVPDWVRGTQTFKMAVKEASALEVVIASAEPEDDSDDSADDATNDAAPVAKKTRARKPKTDAVQEPALTEA